MKTSTSQTVIRGFQQDDLEEYVKDRLETLSRDFEDVSPDRLGELQGRIKEVKLLLKIRERAQNVLEQARKNP